MQGHSNIKFANVQYCLLSVSLPYFAQSLSLEVKIHKTYENNACWQITKYSFQNHA